MFLLVDLVLSKVQNLRSKFLLEMVGALNRRNQNKTSVETSVIVSLNILRPHKTKDFHIQTAIN